MKAKFSKSNVDERRNLNLEDIINKPGLYEYKDQNDDNFDREHRILVMPRVSSDNNLYFVYPDNRILEACCMKDCEFRKAMEKELVLMFD